MKFSSRSVYTVVNCILQLYYLLLNIIIIIILSTFCGRHLVFISLYEYIMQHKNDDIVHAQHTETHHPAKDNF